jgi:hypothetical protein
MESGLDPLSGETSDINMVNPPMETLPVSQTTAPNEPNVHESNTSIANKRLNDAAVEALKNYCIETDPQKVHTLSSKRFTRWMDVLVSDDTNLLSKTIHAMNKTLAWLLDAIRQQDHIEKCWSLAEEQFHRLLLEIKQKN